MPTADNAWPSHFACGAFGHTSELRVAIDGMSPGISKVIIVESFERFSEMAVLLPDFGDYRKLMKECKSTTKFTEQSVVGKRVILTGLTKAPSINGLAGRCVCLDHAKGRYQIDLDGGRKVKVRPDNMIKIFLPLPPLAEITGGAHGFNFESFVPKQIPTSRDRDVPHQQGGRMFVKGKNVETIEELQVGQAVLNYVISIVHGRDASQKRAEQLKRLSKRVPGKTEMTLVCSACGKGGVQLNKCARCRDPAYCSKECQKEHWKAHKKVCGVAADPYFTVRNNVSSVLPKGVAFTDASASDRALFRRRVRELVELKKTTTAPWPSDMPFQDIMKRWVIPDAVCAFLQRIEAQGPTNPEDEHSGANQPLLQPFYVTVYQHGSKPFHGGTCTLNACWDGGIILEPAPGVQRICRAYDKGGDDGGECCADLWLGAQRALLVSAVRPSAPARR